VRHAQIFILRLGIEWKRQRVSAVQNAQRVWNNLNVARGKIWIFGAGQARRDTARNLNDVFSVQRVRLRSKLGVFFRAKNNLRQPFAIAPINEHDSAMIAAHRNPAGKFDLAANIGFAEFVAVVSAVAHVGKTSVSF
jgi:hypothetical protein